MGSAATNDHGSAIKMEDFEKDLTPRLRISSGGSKQAIDPK